MDTHTIQRAQENPLLKSVPEHPQVRPPSCEGSPISPIGSIPRSFSFGSGHERLEPNAPSSLTSGELPSSVVETQKASPSITEKQLHHSPESSKRANLLYGWWTFEILAFVVSFASLIAIIIILKHYNGQSPPNWPHNLTLNLVLSWFTTLYKTSLLVPIASYFGQTGWLHYRSTSQPLADIGIYDSTSRGPLGSLQLLWKFKTKYVASIGAIATILALGIDPIVQQTLSIKVKILESDNSATLGRAQSFLQWDLQDYIISTWGQLGPTT